MIMIVNVRLPGNQGRPGCHYCADLRNAAAHKDKQVLFLFLYRLNVHFPKCQTIHLNPCRSRSDLAHAEKTEGLQKKQFC